MMSFSLSDFFSGLRGFPGTPGTGHGGGHNEEMLMKMKMNSSADPSDPSADPQQSFPVAGQDEDVQQELDTYVELGQRRGRGTQVSFTECYCCQDLLLVQIH